MPLRDGRPGARSRAASAGGTSARACRHVRPAPPTPDAPGRAAQFAEEWRRGVVPLRQSYGFEIQGWVVDETDEFVWVLRHADHDSFDAADAAYYRSSERAALDPDPARLIQEARHDWVTPVR
jgi:hypothetical protein